MKYDESLQTEVGILQFFFFFFFSFVFVLFDLPDLCLSCLYARLYYTCLPVDRSATLQGRPKHFTTRANAPSPLPIPVVAHTRLDSFIAC